MVKKHPQHFCNKPTEVYPTTYYSLYVALHYAGFDVKTGRKVNEMGPYLLHCQNNAIFLKYGNHTFVVLNPNLPTPQSTHG